MPRVELQTGAVHFRESGSGRPVVLLHGIGSNSASWAPQLAGLSLRFRTVAWDAPGYGDSALLPGPGRIAAFASALRDFLQSLRLEDVILVGHSLGGIVAVEFFRSGPGPVTGLILADTTRGGGSGDPAVQRRRLEERLQWIGTRSAETMARERAPQLLSPDAPPDVVQQAVGRMAEVREDGYAFAAEALATADTSEVLPSISLPTLLIWGAEDRVTPLEEAWQIRDRLPNPKLEVIPNAGHLCYLEQPARFNALVSAYA